jgi:hypothetical protein
MGQDEGEPRNLQLKGRIRPKPKENHAGMGMFEAEYPLAKIPVASNENALLLVGKRENFWIRDTLRISSPNLGRIMTKLFEVRKPSVF